MDQYQQDKIFTDGFYLNTVSEKAPNFIITNQTVHVEKAIAWLTDNKHLADEKGYIRLIGKEGQSGKRYFEVDTWKPIPKEAREQVISEDTINPEDVPF